MNITTGLLVDVSLYVIFFSIIVIIIVLLYLFFFKSKSIEEKKAGEVFKKFEKIKKEGFSNESDSGTVVASKKGIDLDKTNSSLKNLLIKKFKPKLETQLGSKIEVIDLSSEEEKLFVLIEVSGVRINLVLDSSGKIIDYKKI